MSSVVDAKVGAKPAEVVDAVATGLEIMAEARSQLADIDQASSELDEAYDEWLSKDGVEPPEAYTQADDELTELREIAVGSFINGLTMVCEEPVEVTGIFSAVLTAEEDELDLAPRSVLHCLADQLQVEVDPNLMSDADIDDIQLTIVHDGVVHAATYGSVLLEPIGGKQDA